MLGANSNIPTWQTVTLPHASFPDDVFTLAKVKISDDHLLLLTEENDPEYDPEKTPPVPGVSVLLQIPRIKQFFLLNLNTLHVERIKSGINLKDTFTRGMGPYRMIQDGKHSFLCLEGGAKLTLWRFHLSEDYRTIVRKEEKCNENLSFTPIGEVILYKQKLCILTFILVRTKKETYGGGLGFFGGSKTEKVTYDEKIEEKFVTIDIETGKCIEKQTQGTKPTPRSGYSAAFDGNQIFVFGGSVRQDPSKIDYYFEDLWALDLYSLTWRELRHQVSPVARSSAAACTVEDKFYIFGGRTQDANGADQQNRELFVYDIGRNTWQHIQADSKVFEDSSHFFNDLVFHKDKLFICKNANIYFLQIDKVPKNGEKRQPHKAINTSSSQNSKQRIIFTERPFPDITFKVEQKEIPAHRAILYSGSTLFRNMFTSGMEESNKNVIEIPNMKASVFEAVLEYIYCGTVEINDDIAWEVLQEADKYSLPGLKAICEDFLTSSITVENVVQTINMSEKYEANSLRAATLKYVAKNVDRVFEEADIHQLKKSTLLEIYKIKS